MKPQSSYKDMLLNGDILDSDSSGNDVSFKGATDSGSDSGDEASKRHSDDGNNCSSTESEKSDQSNEAALKKESVSQVSFTNHLNGHNNHDESKSHLKKQINKQRAVVRTECLICCVCLNDDKNDDSDELLECDSCGFYVHESCYGINELNSTTSSNTSNASTEPWFCDPCLLKHPLSPHFTPATQVTHQCELCPNTQCGLLKETEDGRFVHLLCAMYAPGVTFRDTDKLWPVVLDEIPAMRWGEHACALCEDDRYARTGICIQCDAGLCKGYFHVTCAQAHGFLLDPNKQHENDPYLAYCRQHIESSVLKQRKMNYLAMISSYNSKALKLGGDRLFLKNENKNRYLQKLENARENYILQKNSLEQQTIKNQKVPRMISTCPSALKQLLAKNEQSGEYHHTKNMPGINQQSTHPFSKSISFTEHFVKQYFERENKMFQSNKQLAELKVSQAKLTNQELKLQTNYETKLKQSEYLKKDYDHNIELLKTSSNLIELLNLTKPNHKDLNSIILEHEISFEVGHRPAELLSKSTLSKGKTFRTNNNDQMNRSTLDAICVVCEKKINSHLLVDCDTCKKFYHINCLSPALSSVPRKTKLYGWECSKCVHLKDSDNSELEEENRIDVNSPRLLRGKRSVGILLESSSSTPGNTPIKKELNEERLAKNEKITKKTYYIKKKDRLNATSLNKTTQEVSLVTPNGYIKKKDPVIIPDANDSIQSDDESVKPKGKYIKKRVRVSVPSANYSVQPDDDSVSPKGKNVKKKDRVSMASANDSIQEISPPSSPKIHYGKLKKFLSPARNSKIILNASLQRSIEKNPQIGSSSPLNGKVKPAKSKKAAKRDRSGDNNNESFNETIESVISETVAKKAKKTTKR